MCDIDVDVQKAASRWGVYAVMWRVFSTVEDIQLSARGIKYIHWIDTTVDDVYDDIGKQSALWGKLSVL